MNLLITIFGGMLATVMLHSLGRRLRLSNFWAAVTAAAIPSVVYLVYASADWPGLDTLTMHMVAYPTVSLLMFQFYSGKGSQPEKLHWVPKVLVAFFVTLTILYGGFVYIAGSGIPPAFAHWLLPDTQGKTIHTGFAGVVAHGEDAAKSIAHHRRMEAILARMGWQVEVVGLDALRPDHANGVVVHLRDRHGADVPGLRVSLALGRPGQPAQETIDLPVAADASYRALAALPGDGAWLATLIIEGKGERVALERVIGGE